MWFKIKKYISRFFRKSWVQHTLFWTFAYFILLSIFSSENYKILADIFNPIADNFYTLIFLFTLFLAVIVNLYLCIPMFLKKKRYLLYILSFLAVLFSFTFFNQLLFDKWIDYILPDFYFISYYDYWDIATFFIVFLSATTLLKLSKEWFELNESRQEMIRLEKEKAEIELKALMGQINPHFLFNSLNVLYNLALKSSTETPSAIIKLSDILRYVIYEAGKKAVPISAEVDLIRNYIDLQRFRVDKNSRIDFECEIADDYLSVAPMLFLPLVENGFKHGIKGTIADTFIDIQLNASSEKMDFTVTNNRDKNTSFEKAKTSGIGLKNIASRLQLLYPARHHLEISEEENKFKVKLTLVNK
jgi:sensor histidine kinase YesM